MFSGRVWQAAYFTVQWCLGFFMNQFSVELAAGPFHDGGLGPLQETGGSRVKARISDRRYSGKQPAEPPRFVAPPGHADSPAVELKPHGNW